MRAGESQQATMMLGSNFLDSIHEQIDKEDQFDNVILDQDQKIQTGSDTTAANSSSLLRPIGGFAVAASVGALAFMGLQNVGVLKGPTSVPTDIVDKSAYAILNSFNICTFSSHYRLHRQPISENNEVWFLEKIVSLKFYSQKPNR